MIPEKLKLVAFAISLSILIFVIYKNITHKKKNEKRVEDLKEGDTFDLVDKTNDLTLKCIVLKNDSVWFELKYVVIDDSSEKIRLITYENITYVKDLKL